MGWCFQTPKDEERNSPSIMSVNGEGASGKTNKSGEALNYKVIASDT